MKKIRFSKEKVFFEMFDKVVSNLTKANSLLFSVMLSENLDNIESRIKEIRELEQEGDMLTHEIIKKLHTSSTSIDRKDIHALASRLDDILDLTWDTADKLSVFKLKEPTKEAIRMSKNLVVITEVVARTIRDLKKKKYSHVLDYCIEISKLENKIDRIYTDALEKLFKSEDPILIIKWKEIYEHLENASDRCKDVANIINAIMIKSG